ncbi:MAG: hypothetical protein AAGC79_16435 [Pseudomonadota bacterium]
MAKEKKVRYLKIDRGRYFYQRRIPKKLQPVLGETVWLRRCGDVSYSKAVQLVVTWAEEHDKLIKDLESPDRQREVKTERRRAEKEFFTRLLEAQGGIPYVDVTDGDDTKFVPLDMVPKKWQWAQEAVADLDEQRKNTAALPGEVMQLQAQIDRALDEGGVARQWVLPPYPELLEVVSRYAGQDVIRDISFLDAIPERLDDDEYLDRLEELHEFAFGNDRDVPGDPDDRDEYEFVRRKLERKISDVKPNPDTVSEVAERYYSFNGIRPVTLRKYRMHIGLLIQQVGDVPIQHVSPTDLRMLRDSLLGRMLPASVHTVFTPIKGLFAYAVEEQLIEVNPTHGVKLPKDRRPLEESKWLPFTPDEFSRIMDGVDDIWGRDVLGLAEERRVAIRMIVRVLAFTAMRPIEVLRLQPEDVNERLIRVASSKTESSTRVIPPHPEIMDFPDWVASGGLRIFSHIQKDPVEPVRHNFLQLIRKKLPSPIIDKRKSLYSLRATFSNAMRRAGADKNVRRAILGHVEAGALRNYDDGPEFEHKRRWVSATNPRLDYEPTEER